MLAFAIDRLTRKVKKLEQRANQHENFTGYDIYH